MSDSLPEDAWVQSFQQSQPKQLQSSLQRRLATSTNHAQSLAELYKQRAQIEQTYADSLAKLARSAEQGSLIKGNKSGVDWDKSSGEARLWDVAIQDVAETSSAHSTLAAVLRTDFEQPIRDLPNKVVAWRRIGEQDGSLEKTLKEYEKVSSKLEKAKSKKADALQAELYQLTSSLSSLSPMVYTTYQRLDEQRLAGLKEILVRWGTVRGDMATRDGERAERAIASLLGWEPSEEVLAVGQRLGGMQPSRAASIAPSLSISTDRRASTNTNATNATDFSPRPTPKSNGSSNALGGIKGMLGRSKTMGRKRSGSNATSVQSRDPDGFDTLPEERPVDNDGFSVPPPDRHRTLWDEPDDEIPLSALALKSAPLQPTRAASTERAASIEEPRVDLSIKAAPIEETEEQRQAALAKVQQTLAMPSAPSRRATLRGRRDVRNTMFPGSMPMPNVDEPNPFDSPSLSAPAMPVAQGPGLRANITEAINVIMRAGQVQRLQINGEVHVGLQNGVGPIHIRIDQFEQLEKIAPNPQYLGQVPDKPGEYTLDTNLLASATPGPKGTLLFKYQVHTEPSAELPLVLEPAFLCKDGETRMLLNYRAKPIPNLTVVASFEPGVSVNNVQAKPAGGVWSPSTRKMTWDIGSVQGEGKVIAKFSTDSGEPLRPSNIQASWALEGQLVSGIDLGVVGGQFEQVTRGLQTGKYIAEPVTTNL